ncbi:MAG: hypothetical protein ACYDC8_15430, partial [Gammaproteobacteria bacterium]
MTDYLFCISGQLANENQGDQLRDEIKAVFDELASTHAHLSHLSDIAVRVMDWGYFDGILQRNPYLVFRWFPKTRPVGLTPLEKQPTSQGFRDYLNEDRLPYLSRSAFRQQQENVAAIPMDDETAMLEMLSDVQIIGLVVTGSGGVGKTRLAYELGWRARNTGWTVLVVGTQLKSEALAALAERVHPDACVLLIFDYIETQRNFVELANELTNLKNTYALRLHFVANCRSSYYHVLEGAIEHRRIDLTPAHTSDTHDWPLKYRQAVVRYILEQGVPGFDDRHLELCRDVPVFAVFLSYLIANNRQPWLEELLVEKDFGQWVASRVKRTLRDDGIDQDLAVLMCLFPMPRSALVSFDSTFRKIIECLSTDDWISSLSDEAATWATAHDVLADRIVLSYLERVGAAAELFVERLFALAQAQGLLRSCLTTLQRIAGQPAVKSLSWQQIIRARCASNTEDWRDIRDLLIWTSLLAEADKLDLLESCPTLWLGSELELDFQNAIGWLARWASRNDHATQLTETQRATLTDWIGKAAIHAGNNNYVLTSAMRWCPDRVRDLAAVWISTRPALFQTHYLIVAWLKSDLPFDEISGSVSQWLARYPDIAHVSFVVAAWLGAAGKDGLDLVREPIRAWLSGHKTDPEASHVYNSWLGAAGKDGLDLVREPIRAWLSAHKTDSEASHVYKAWLDAAGKDGLDLVREPIRAWLSAHKTDPEASHVYNSWLDAAGKDGLDLVREPIRAWLSAHKTDSEASHVYKAWLDAAGKDGLDLVREPIHAWLSAHMTDPEASHVYNSWLDAAGKDGLDLVREPIRAWLSAH